MNKMFILLGISLILAVNALAVDEPLPVLYFSFDEDLGDEVEDLSGNGNDGTFFGGAEYGAGKFNGGLELEGPDTVDVADSETLQFIEELTVGVWVNLVGTANQKIIGKSPTGSGWVIGVNGGIYPEVWDKNGTNHTTTKGTIPAGTWTHLAMTYSSITKAMVLYINGAQVVSLSNGGIPIGQTNNMLVIGASPWGKDWPSAGLYDDVKLYNIAFSADQVKTMLMAEGVTKVAVSPGATAATTWAEIKYSQ